MAERDGQVKILSRQAIVAEKCHVAVSFLDRLVGLIGRSGLAPGQGMLFPRCGSIHMWFMRFPIDVVFAVRVGGSSPKGELRSLQVTSVRSSVRAWRLLPVFDNQASEALELPEGTVERLGLKPGETLEIVWPEAPTDSK